MLHNSRNMNQRPTEEGARALDYRTWAALGASLAYAALSLVPAPAFVEAALSRELFGWSNLWLVRAAVALGGGAVALGIWRMSRNGVRLPLMFCLVLVVATLCAAANLVLIGKYLAGLIPNTWTNDVIELYAAHKGGLVDLYELGNAFSPPLLTPLYGPGYFFTLQSIRKLLDVDAGLAARLVSTLAIIGLTGGVYLAARQLLPRLPAAVAPLIFWATFPTLVWSGPPTKPEYLACALAILAFGLCLGEKSTQSSARVFFGGALFGAALLVKFTIVAMFGALLLHYAVQRRWRGLAIVAVGSAMPLLLVYATLWGPTHGGVWLFTVTGNAARPDFGRAFIATFENTLPFVVPALVIAAAASWLWSARLRSARGVVSLAALLSFAGFMVSSSRPGSSANYLLEFAVLATVILAAVINDELTDSALTVRSGLVLTLIAVVLSADLPRRYALLAQSASRYGGDRAVARSVLSDIKTSADEFILTAPDYARETIETRHTPLVYDALQFTLMQDNGKVSDVPILEALRGGRVRHAVLKDDLDIEEQKGYGRRNFSSETLRYLRDHFDCRSVSFQHIRGSVVHCTLR